jgi:hypothetical protein
MNQRQHKALVIDFLTGHICNLLPLPLAVQLGSLVSHANEMTITSSARNGLSLSFGAFDGLNAHEKM